MTPWTDFVGPDLDEAFRVLRAERPDMDVRPVPLGSAVSADHREHRLRLWYDEGSRTVAHAPAPG